MHFEDLEFVVLWEQITGDRMPPPFIFTSRTPMYYDFLREKRSAAERVEARWDGALGNLAEVMAEPDIRIVVNGFDGRDLKHADGRVRMMALRRAGRGYLLKQLPGETYVHSGGFTAVECDPLSLAEAVVDALPEVGAGRQADVKLDGTQGSDYADDDIGRTIIDDVFEDAAVQRTKRFLNSSVVCAGTIEVIQGHSKFGPRGITEHLLEWRDLEDDGRYVIGGEPPFIAAAVDSSRLTNAINVRVAAVVRAIRDERGILSGSE
ncbi:ESX secretion-associated protein EspG [Nocardia sp. NBC_01327]|uniref:ESX secretion-associated protein EspG n=1 Tax=Nocardia sp. NBC_01327 TaxID=2903593 RepID=UPI002E15D576|nr:ESX secretion-associated protein EspG [Nocardia sp. NBC_01327]